MACTDCCRCCHEPPDDVSDVVVEAVERLTAIAGTKPYYARRGGYRTRSCLHGTSHGTELPDGGYMRGRVWENEQEAHITIELVNIDVAVAEAILRVAYGAPVAQHARRRTKTAKMRRR